MSRKGSYPFYCEICNVVFHRWKYQKPRFCGRECLYASQRINPNKGTFIYTGKSGEEHHNWKTKPGYDALHDWVRRHKGKAKHCEQCGDNEPRAYNWANISGEYKRELSDFKSMCVPCHMEYDNHPWLRRKNGQAIIGK